MHFRFQQLAALLLTLGAVTGLAQPQPLPSTAYTRSLLRATNSAHARALLGVAGGVATNAIANLDGLGTNTTFYTLNLVSNLTSTGGGQLLLTNPVGDYLFWDGTTLLIQGGSGANSGKVRAKSFLGNGNGLTNAVDEIAGTGVNVTTNTDNRSFTLSVAGVLLNLVTNQGSTLSNAVGLAAGPNITITTNGNGRLFTIAATGGGGGDVFLANTNIFTGSNAFPALRLTGSPGIIYDSNGLVRVQFDAAGTKLNNNDGTTIVESTSTATTVASPDSTGQILLENSDGSGVKISIPNLPTPPGGGNAIYQNSGRLYSGNSFSSAVTNSSGKTADQFQAFGDTITNAVVTKSGSGALLTFVPTGTNVASGAPRLTIEQTTSDQSTNREVIYTTGINYFGGVRTDTNKLGWSETWETNWDPSDPSNQRRIENYRVFIGPTNVGNGRYLAFDLNDSGGGNGSVNEYHAISAFKLGQVNKVNVFPLTITPATIGSVNGGADMTLYGRIFLRAYEDASQLATLSLQGDASSYGFLQIQSKAASPKNFFVYGDGVDVGYTGDAYIGSGQPAIRIDPAQRLVVHTNIVLLGGSNQLGTVYSTAITNTGNIQSATLTTTGAATVAGQGTFSSGNITLGSGGGGKIAGVSVELNSGISLFSSASGIMKIMTAASGNITQLLFGPGTSNPSLMLTNTIGLQVSDSIGNPTNLVVNGLGTLSTNQTLSVVATGLTNTLGVNVQVLGFTGTSVTFYNNTKLNGISLGTIATAQTLVLQPGGALAGSSCAASGVHSF